MKEKPKSVFEVRLVENWKGVASFWGEGDGVQAPFFRGVLCAHLFCNINSSLQSGDGQTGGKPWQSQESLYHVLGL